jgi:hypothetical protein
VRAKKFTDTIQKSEMKTKKYLWIKEFQLGGSFGGGRGTVAGMAVRYMTATVPRTN